MTVDIYIFLINIKKIYIYFIYYMQLKDFALIYWANELNKKTEDVKESIKGFDERIDAIEKDHKIIDDTVSNINSAIIDINSTITNINDDVLKFDKKFNTVETNVDKLLQDNITQDNTINKINSAVVNIDNNLTNVNGNLLQLNKTSEQNTSDISIIKSEVSDLNDTIQYINTSVVNINENITNINDDVLKFDNKFNSVEIDINKLQSDVLLNSSTINKVNSTLTNVNNNLTNLNQEVLNIDNYLDTVKTDLTSIKTDIISKTNTDAYINKSIVNINQNITNINDDILDHNGKLDDLKAVNTVQTNLINTIITTNDKQTNDINTLNVEVLATKNRVSVLESYPANTFENELVYQFVKDFSIAYETHNAFQYFPLIYMPKNSSFTVDDLKNAYKMQDMLINQILKDTKTTLAGYKIGQCGIGSQTSLGFITPTIAPLNGSQIGAILANQVFDGSQSYLRDNSGNIVYDYTKLIAKDSSGNIVYANRGIKAIDSSGNNLTDNSGNFVYVNNGNQVYNIFGNPVYKSGNPVYDSSGNPVYDSSGNQVYGSGSPVYDGSGSLVYLTTTVLIYDSSGNPVYDSSGNQLSITNTTQLFDGSGNPTYNNKLTMVYNYNPVIVYNNSGNAILDSSGNYQLDYYKIALYQPKPTVSLRNKDYPFMRIEPEFGFIMKNDVKTTRTSQSIKNDIAFVYFGYENPSTRAYNTVAKYPLTGNIDVNLSTTSYGISTIYDMLGAGNIIKGNVLPYTSAMDDIITNGLVSLDIVNDVNPDPGFNFPGIRQKYQDIPIPSCFNGIDYKPIGTYEASPFGALASIANKMIYLGKYLKAGDIVSSGALDLTNTTATENSTYGSGSNYNPNLQGSIKGETPNQNRLKDGSQLLFTITVKDKNGFLSKDFLPVNFRLTY